MDIKRLTSALLGLPMVIIVLLLGNQYIIDIAVAIIAIIALHEYFNAFKKYKPIKWIGYLMAMMIALIHIFPQKNLIAIVSLGIPFIIAILYIQLVLKDLEISIIDIMITFFGIAYIVFFMAFIPLIAGSENGKILIWYVFTVAWGTDIFAYLIGYTFKLGKHTFSKISPKKSIEGCIAGLIGAILLTVIYTVFVNQFLHMQISYVTIVLIAILLSIIGQFGDFAASSIKRFVGIKDFSNLIPGHGGILDRIDSLIFIAPFAYILLVLF